MEREALLQAVLAAAPGSEAQPNPQLPEVKAPLGRFRALMERLKAEPSLAFDFPMSMTCVDWPAEGKITAVYHLLSMAHRHKVVVKVDLPREAPSAPTVSDLWPGCEWFEREAYDMFGVAFEGHPDLRRILLTDDWVGWPLRKDYRDSRIAGKPY